MRRWLVKIVSLVLLVSLVTAVLPDTSAGFRQYGTLVGESTTDPDAAGMLLVNLPAAALAYVDTDNSGTPNFASTSTHDVFYLSISGAATVQTNDVRVSKRPSATGSAGTQVQSGDTDRGDTLVTAGLGSWAFEDIHTTGNGKTGIFNLGEPLYLDINGDLAVSTGDIKVIRESSSDTTAGSTAWTFVTASDSRLGNALVALAGFQYAVYDADGDGLYTTDDGVVIDGDSNNLLAPGDVRLTKVGSITGGSMPKLGETLTFHNLLALGGVAFAFADATNPGVVDDNEVIYIDADGSTTVTVDDIRIGPVSGTTSSSTGAGDHVETGDADIGTVLTAQGTLRYVDNNGNNVFDSTDNLYLDIGGASTTNVEAGDLRLARGGTSGSTPGTRVKTTDSDHNRPLAAVGAAPVMFLDFDGGNVYGNDDSVYLDSDNNGVITPGDVRLGKGGTPATTFGVFVKQSNTDSEPCHRFAFATAQAGWVDEGTPGTAGLSEVIYLDRSGSGTVSSFDIRLSGGGIAAAGSFVLPGNQDVNNALTLFGAAMPFFFHDSNGDGSYSVGSGTQVDDTVYLDSDGSTTVTVGDVRITKAGVGTGSAGTKVQTGNSDTNLPLTALPAGFALRGFDVDGNGIFDDDDALYLNIDEGARPVNAITDTSLVAAGCATVGDVRISGTGGSTTTGGGGGGGGGGGTAPPPATTTTSPTPTQTTTSPSPTETEEPSPSPTETEEPSPSPTTPSPTTTEPQEDNGTPGPALLLVVLAVFGLLALVRRRQ